jgi:hypothetical protein
MTILLIIVLALIAADRLAKFAGLVIGFAASVALLFFAGGVRRFLEGLKWNR